MEEDICNISDKKLTSKIYKEFIQFNLKNPIKKWAEDLDRRFFQKAIYRWQTDAWKGAQHH